MKEDKKVKNMLQKYLQWPLVLSLLVICANAAAALLSKNVGIVLSIFTILYLFCAGMIYWYGKKKLIGGLVSFAADYSWSQKKLLSSMELPYGIADLDGRILWTNQAFAAVIKDEKSSRKNLTALFEGITPQTLQEMEDSLEVHSPYASERYRVSIKRMEIRPDDDELKKVDGPVKENQLLAVYLYDETEIFAYMQAITDQKMVAGLVYLDNYDEALESVEEVRRSLLVALIERKINKYISATNGIVKKLEKDKYFFIIKQKYMAQLEEERFGLLEDIKTVNIGNEMAVTLSIGIGMNGESYIQNYEYARTAIDMALGRGGDQAVVKCGEKIQYYGGKSQQLEKTTRVKARVKAHALRELLETKDRLLIMGHRIGDIDSFGSAIGVYRIAAALNKKASIVINEVTSSVRPMMDRFVDNSEYPEDLFLNGEEAAKVVDANTALVVVDVNRPSYTEEPELLKLVKTIVVIDHHRQSSEIITGATLSYVEPYASSACELVAEILQYVADSIRIKSAEADAMYAGIVIDTNNFKSQAGVRTFEAAAFLRRNGADVTRVRKLFRDKMEDYKARAEAVRQAEVFEGAFAISVCPAENVESPTVVGAQAANELLNIVGIKASVVLTPYKEKIYLSARSIDEINVQLMMEKLGGGGHRTVAGAQLAGTDIEEAKEKIKDVIRAMQEKGEI
ncbi:MAG: DHH family phosphoesterase [Lachnospiraceae bacterium]|jgi:c-di-AMP phosphodiesterase-like protein|nr:DHH family phosphoesterase [Lachnospiraceae bacterium]NBJ81890.1 DHH family phosphoesterase [bacterium 1XD42-76]NBK04390.1 DHH family phosphoesterase [bacterium 1XD42-94]